MDDPTPVTLTATCHTPGCPVAGRQFTAPFYANPEPPTFRGSCMRCGQALTDVVPVHSPTA